MYQEIRELLLLLEVNEMDIIEESVKKSVEELKRMREKKMEISKTITTR